MDTTQDALNEASWQCVFLVLILLAISTMAQPASRVCNFPPRFRLYLRSSPIICAFDTLHLLTRIIIYKSSGYSLRRALELTAISRSENGNYEDRNDSEKTTFAEWFHDPRRSTLFRWLFFAFAALPQAIKLLSIRDIPWTQVWAVMYLSSFLTLEYLLYFVPRNPRPPPSASLPLHIASSPTPENDPYFLYANVKGESTAHTAFSLLPSKFDATFHVLRLDIRLDKAYGYLALLSQTTLLLWATHALLHGPRSLFSLPPVAAPLTYLLPGVSLAIGFLVLSTAALTALGVLWYAAVLALYTLYTRLNHYNILSGLPYLNSYVRRYAVFAFLSYVVVSPLFAIYTLRFLGKHLWRYVEYKAVGALTLKLAADITALLILALVTTRLTQFLALHNRLFRRHVLGLADAELVPPRPRRERYGTAVKAGEDEGGTGGLAKPGWDMVWGFVGCVVMVGLGTGWYAVRFVPSGAARAGWAGKVW